MRTLFRVLSLASFIACSFSSCDPVFAITKTPAKDISANVADFDGNLSENDTDVQKALQTLNDMPVVGSETDPVFVEWLSTTPPIYSETDPVFSASEAHSITSTDTSNWDTAYGWGNHAGLYLPIEGTAEAVNGLTITPGASISGSNTGDQVLPTRDSLGLATDDTVTFANLSGTNTGDQDLSGLLKLDQTTPQTIINGKPNFSDGVNISGSSFATWAIESKSMSGVVYGQGISITNNLSDGYVNLGVTGEVIFGGNQMFFGFNDRTLDESGRWGMYGVNGGFNFWNNEYSRNIMSFTKNNHIAIGANSYGTWNNSNLIPATLYVDARSDGYPSAMFLNGNVLIGTTTNTSGMKLKVNGKILAQDKIAFTQTDGNEYIDSLADGYMDYGATTAHRFLANVKLTADNRKIIFGTGDDASIYYDGTNAIINPKEVGSGYLNIKGITLVDDKIMFTQTDGNEYIDSLADGYMDYGATTQHRFNNDVDVDGDITADSISAVHKAADGTAAVADGTYTVGIGTSTNGTITIQDGIITAITEAT